MKDRVYSIIAHSTTYMSACHKDGGGLNPQFKPRLTFHRLSSQVWYVLLYYTFKKKHLLKIFRLTKNYFFYMRRVLGLYDTGFSSTGFQQDWVFKHYYQEEIVYLIPWCYKKKTVLYRGFPIFPVHSSVIQTELFYGFESQALANLVVFMHCWHRLKSITKNKHMTERTKFPDTWVVVYVVIFLMQRT